MSSSGSLSGGSGLILPIPNVKILSTAGTNNGAHYRAQAGGIDKTQFEQLKRYDLSIFLLRYKRGTKLAQPMNSGYRYDHKRGWVHPSPNRGAIIKSKYNGGSHSVGLIRETEWLVTKHDVYDALLEPELWFTNNGNLLNYPINEWFNLGKSGQGARSGNYGGNVYQDSAAWIDRQPKKLSQEEYFAFAYAIRNPKDPRNWIVGAPSRKIKAHIFPKVFVTYSTPPLKERGRMVMISQQ